MDGGGRQHGIALSEQAARAARGAVRMTSVTISPHEEPFSVRTIVRQPGIRSTIPHAMKDTHRALRHIAGVLRGTQLVVLGVALLSGTLLWRETTSFQRVDAWVEHSHEVIDAIDQARNASLRAGMWIRSLAVEPGAQVAGEARAACQLALDEARRLQELTLSDSEQSLRARRIDSELRVTVGWIRNAVDIGEAEDGVEPLVKVLRMRILKDSGRGLRDALDDMLEHEKGNLLAHIRLQAQHLDRLKMLALGMATLLCGALGWSFVYSRQLVRASHRDIDRLAETSLKDPLTGLANRRGLLEAVEPFPPDRPFSIIAFDLDRFKEVNDRHGHGAGDEVLRAVAARLALQCRDHDILARLGGDEFVVVLTGVGDPSRAATIAARIRLALREPVAAGGHRLQVGASLGVSTRGVDGERFDDLLRIADDRSYEAKRAGRHPSPGAGSKVVSLHAETV